MMFAVVWGIAPVGLRPPTQRATTTIDGDHWPGNHLSEPKHCSDQPGRL
jgi:hypothetical protein